MTIREMVDAKKERFGERDLKQVFAGASKLVAMKGKKVQTFDLAKEGPPNTELTKAVLGPSGNLRAPSMRLGKTWLVGFSEEEYGARFG